MAEELERAQHGCFAKVCHVTSSERLQIQVTKVVMLLVWGVGGWVWGMEAVRYVE